MVESREYLDEDINSVNKKLFCGNKVCIPKEILKKQDNKMDRKNMITEESDEKEIASAVSFSIPK